MTISFTPGPCETCGAEMTLYDGLILGDQSDEPLYVCTSCAAAAHVQAMEDYQAGRVYDAEDLLAEARGGPKARMKYEKEGPTS